MALIDYVTGRSKFASERNVVRDERFTGPMRIEHLEPASDTPAVEELSLPDVQPFRVGCHSCGTTYDALRAGWCRCVSKRPSISCPGCHACLCASPAPAILDFWRKAPPELWGRLSQEQTARELQSRHASVAKRSASVLVVDDDEEIRAIAALMLQEMGYCVRTAADAAEALLIVAEWRPDIVLTDALMPKVDGRQLCRLIKASDENIKVAIMTSIYTSTRYRNEAFRTFGADEYLAKPVDFSKLQQIMQKLSPTALEMVH